MALENSEVLENLTKQLQEVTQQVNQLTETRVKLMGAIDVLTQIEDSKKEEGEVATTEVVADEAPAEEVPESVSFSRQWFVRRWQKLVNFNKKFTQIFLSFRQ